MDEPVEKFFDTRELLMEDQAEPAWRPIRPPRPIPAGNPTVVLISPNRDCRHLLRWMMEPQRATVLREFSDYPSYANLDALRDLDCAAIVVDIDVDLDLAMDFVEAICIRKLSVTVMVYSGSADATRMVRAMRAGAREFLAGTNNMEMNE